MPVQLGNAFIRTAVPVATYRSRASLWRVLLAKGPISHNSYTYRNYTPRVIRAQSNPRWVLQVPQPVLVLHSLPLLRAGRT